jgi:hypothetical protein
MIHPAACAADAQCMSDAGRRLMASHARLVGVKGKTLTHRSSSLAGDKMERSAK